MPTNLDAATLRAVRDELTDLAREIGSTANGQFCYGVWSRRIGAIADRFALAEAEAPRPVACKHGDPSCPCQDGDPCHYEATATTNAIMPPDDTQFVIRKAEHE